MDTVYLSLLQARQQRGGGFLLLLDPDRVPLGHCTALAEAAGEAGVDALLVGTSFSLESKFSSAMREIKQAADVPVIIFPGSFAQVTPHADAILFSSLISGRNASYLIEEQVKGAPLVKQCQLEAIPTGYMLIESGSLTSVQFISNTMPIPRTKNDLACAHALAAEYLGMKLVYLEAGSGANGSIPPAMVQAVSSYVDIPVMVGGGITLPEACADKISAGASFVVVGTAFEGPLDTGRLREMAAAAHPQEPIKV